jgi:hypothetical protein
LSRDSGILSGCCVYSLFSCCRNGRIKLNSSGDATNIDLFGSNGSATFKGDLTIADQIIHDGDTNTAIRFPAADTFTVETGGSEALRVNSNQRLLVGHTAQRGLGQLEIEGTSFENSGLTLVRNANSTGGTALNICKTRGSKGSTTSVQDDDVLGGINFRGADGANLRDACDIRGEVDGSPSQGTDMPGRLVFRTSADGSSSPTERLRIDSSGRVLVGNTQDSSPFSWGLGLQVAGTSTNAGLSIRRDQNSSGGALLMFVKSRGSLNGNTVVQDGDQIGGMYFNAADGTDVNSYAAQIAAEIDGTPGSNDVPGRLKFSTTADGASSPTERLRIDSSGRVLINKTTNRDKYFNGTYTGQLQVEGTSDATRLTQFVHNANSASQHILILGKSRGTSTGSYTVVQDGDFLGTLSFQGADGDEMVDGARIDAVVNGTVANDSMPTDIVFKTNQANERVRFTNTGRIGIGTDDPQGFLVVQGNSNDSTTPSIRLQDGTDARQVQITNSSGDFLVKTCGSDDNTHGSIKIFESGIITLNNGGASGTNTERLRIDTVGTFHFKNGALVENGIVDTTARTGTQAVNLDNGMVHYFQSSSTGTWKPNFRVNSTNTLNNAMGTGDVVSPTMIVNKSNTAHYADTIQVDGTDVTPEWLGGAPTEGGGNNTWDIYSYTIIKTGNAAFKCFASVSNYT